MIRPARTLRQLLVESAAPLNALRLVLALLVLVSHSSPLAGRGPDPSWPTLRPSTSFGGFAVGAFFALSGLLVTMSGLRRTPLQFIRSRLLRVIPAYLTVLAICAAVLGPVIWFLDHRTLHGYLNLSSTGPVSYVVRNVLLPVHLQYPVNDVFATTTAYGRATGGSVLNGSIWTLPYEVRCYGVALVIVLLGRALGATRVASLALAIAGVLVIVPIHAGSPLAAVTPAWFTAPVRELLFVFVCGALLGTLAERIRVTPALIAAAGLVFVGTSLAGGAWFRTCGLGSLALLLPFVASLLPAERMRFFRNDLSYGVYVWAFPVQQTLNYAGLASNLLVFIALATLLTLALAAASWFLVEQPALRLRPRSDVAGRSTTEPLDQAASHHDVEPADPVEAARTT